jgi:hypothetical protein
LTDQAIKLMPEEKAALDKSAAVVKQLCRVIGSSAIAFYRCALEGKNQVISLI